MTRAGINEEITPIMSPSLTRGFLGGLGSSSILPSESETCSSASASEASSTLSEAAASSKLSVASPLPSELDSALTTKVGLAMRGVQRHETELEETLAIKGMLEEPKAETGQQDTTEEKPSLVGEH